MKEVNDLLPKAPLVISQSRPYLAAYPTLNEQGDVFLLDDDLVMDVYNISFDDFQRRIVQA